MEKNVHILTHKQLFPLGINGHMLGITDKYTFHPLYLQIKIFQVKNGIACICDV